MIDKKDNSIHASIHDSDKDIGVEKKKIDKDKDKKDNSIHARIHKKDEKIGGGYVKKVLDKKK